MITAVLGVTALLVWGGFEVAFRAPGAASSLRPKAGDRTSTPLLVLAYALAIIIPVALRGVAFGSVGRVAWVGVGLSALGLAIRAWAMRTLGGSYSRTLRTTTGQELVSTGPYQWVRHPGYAGSILVWVGAAMAFHSWLAAAIVAVLMLLAYGWRIQSEERMLVGHFGDAYRAYIARTSRLIPRLY